MLLGYHLKESNASQYLHYVTSYACLQKMKKIPDFKTKRAEHKDQGAEPKTKMVMEHTVQKGLRAKGPHSTEE